MADWQEHRYWRTSVSVWLDTGRIFGHPPCAPQTPTLALTNVCNILAFFWTHPLCDCPSSSQRPHAAHLAVDVFFLELCKSGSHTIAEQAAKEICKLEALATEAVDEEERGDLLSHSCPGYSPNTGVLRKQHRRTWYRLGYFADEDAARVAARHWVTLIARGWNPAIVLEQCRAMSNRKSLHSDPGPANANSAALQPIGAASSSGSSITEAAPKPVSPSPPSQKRKGQLALAPYSPDGPPAPTPPNRKRKEPLALAPYSPPVPPDTSMNEDGAARILQWVNQSMPGAILGDHMGCGKTHTFILLASLGRDCNIFSINNPILVVAPSKQVGDWGGEFRRWKPEMRLFYSAECIDGMESTRADWDVAEVLLGNSSQPPQPIGGASTRQGTRVGWPPKCWIRVVSYDFYWSMDRMEDEIFPQHVRLVAFDEVKGFENYDSRTAGILREWRAKWTPTLFVLPIAGTFFSPSCTNACNYLKCMGFNDVAPNTSSILQKLPTCLLRRKEQCNWSVDIKDVESHLRPGQHQHYCQIMGTLSTYGSAAYAAPALLRTCTHIHPDHTKRQSSPADFGLDDLLQGSPKLDWLLLFLIKVLANRKERVLIFADSTHSRRLLFHFFEFVVGNCDNDNRNPRLTVLDEAMFAASVPTIAASTSPRDVRKALSEFSSQSSLSPVLIATATSGGRGLNVPCVTRIIFFDVPKSVRAWWQCIYRGLRPPRLPHQVLYVYNLVMKQTIEEGYYQARWARAGLSEALLPSGDLVANSGDLCAQREMLDE